MLFQIKSRFSNSVRFEGDFGSLKLCVEAAVAAKADLREANLRGANLRGADLREANLGGADLGDANLWRADLGGADLRGADLRGANLRGADLWGANLRGADLRGADLWGANLRGADLWGADLWGANLGGANLRGADLRGADLRSAKLLGERPVLQIGPLGSRNDYLIAFVTDKGVMIRAGCWFGTLADFALRAAKKHGDNKHGHEYEAAIKMIEVHAEIWGKKPMTCHAQIAPKREPPSKPAVAALDRSPGHWRGLAMGKKPRKP